MIMCENCPERTFKITVPALTRGWLMGTEFGLAVVHGHVWESGDAEAPTPDEHAVYEALNAAYDGASDVTVSLTLSQLTHLRDGAMDCVAVHNATPSLDDDETAQRDAAVTAVAAVHRIILDELGEKIDEPEDDAVAFEWDGDTMGANVDVNTGESHEWHSLYLMDDNTWVLRFAAGIGSEDEYDYVSHSYYRVPAEFARDWLAFNRGVSRNKNFAQDMAGTHALLRSIALDGGEDMDTVLMFMADEGECAPEVAALLTPLKAAIRHIPDPTLLEVPCDATPGEDADAPEPWDAKPRRAWVEAATAKGVPVQGAPAYWPGCEMGSYDPMRHVGGVVVGYRWYTLAYGDGVVRAHLMDEAWVEESDLRF